MVRTATPRGGRPAPRTAGRAARAAAAGLLLALLAAPLPSCDSAPGARPRDIVLVVWDTCRGDRVSAHGYPFPTTPRLAAFAADAVSFPRCSSPAPWTPPAHASLFTGLLPRDHGMTEGVGDRVRHGIPLLPATLREAGYETVAVSANPLVSPVTGLSAGFERFVPCFREDQHGQGEEVREAVAAWIRERPAPGGGRRPFLLFVNLMDSHLPYAFEDADVEGMHGAGSAEKARIVAGMVGDRQAMMRLLGGIGLQEGVAHSLGLAYDGAVRRLDRATGGILDDLRGAGLLEGAVVVVTGDHGEGLGEHGEVNHGFSVHEPMLHVPLVIRWPGRFEGGRVVEDSVRLQDLYPTLLEAAGVPVPAGCGKAAEPLRPEPSGHRIALSEFGPMDRSRPNAERTMPEVPLEVFRKFHWRFRGARDDGGPAGPRKWISVVDTRSGGGTQLREELYDLRADPGETRNLLGPGARPEDVAEAARLRARWEAGK